MPYRQKLSDAMKAMNLSSLADISKMKEQAYRKMADEAGVPYEMATRAFENLDREQAAALRRYQDDVKKASERLARELESLSQQQPSEDKIK